MKTLKSSLFPSLYLYVFMLIYLDTLSGAQHIHEAMLIQTASEWNDTFCEAKRFNQTIKTDGCKNVYVMNNYCYGQCKSLYVPYKKRQGLFACYLCTAVKKKQLNITLQCHQKLKTMQKRILLNVVEKCECKRANLKYTLPP